MNDIKSKTGYTVSSLLYGGAGYAGYMGCQYLLFTLPFSKYGQKYSSDYMNNKDVLNKVQKYIDDEKFFNCKIYDLNLEGYKDYLAKNPRGKTLSSKNILQKLLFYIPNVENKKILEILSKPAEKRTFYEKFILSTNNMCNIVLGRDALAGPNGIRVNASKLQAVLFHELGHVCHLNKPNKFNLLLQKLRIPCRKATIIPLSATILLNSTRTNNNKKHDKVANKFLILSPVVGMVLALPDFIEEILASVDGNKIAKKICDKKMYTNIKKCNRTSVCTKIIKLLFTGLGLFMAGYIPKLCASNLRGYEQ